MSAVGRRGFGSLSDFPQDVEYQLVKKKGSQPQEVSGEVIPLADQIGHEDPLVVAIRAQAQASDILESVGISLRQVQDMYRTVKTTYPMMEQDQTFSANELAIQEISDQYVHFRERLVADPENGVWDIFELREHFDMTRLWLDGLNRQTQLLISQYVQVTPATGDESMLQ